MYLYPLLNENRRKFTNLCWTKGRVLMIYKLSFQDDRVISKIIPRFSAVNGPLVRDTERRSKPTHLLLVHFTCIYILQTW